MMKQTQEVLRELKARLEAVNTELEQLMMKQIRLEDEKTALDKAIPALEAVVALDDNGDNQADDKTTHEVFKTDAVTDLAVLKGTNTGLKGFGHGEGMKYAIKALREHGNKDGLKSVAILGVFRTHYGRQTSKPALDKMLSKLAARNVVECVGGRWRLRFEDAINELISK